MAFIQLVTREIKQIRIKADNVVGYWLIGKSVVILAG